MSYHVIKSEDKYIILQVLNYGENVMSRPVYESMDIEKIKKYIKEDMVPVTSVSSGNVKGLTGDPPVKKKKRFDILRRFQNAKKRS